MTDILLIIFAITLVFMSIANRLGTYVNILFLQGLLLFGISFIELKEINTLNLAFILLETVVFKTFAVPFFMSHVIKRNKITREAEPYLPNFVSLVIVTSIIILTYLLSKTIQDPLLNKIYFVVALSALFSGLYIIMTRRKVITHVMGYLVIENGVFILSIAVGSEIPMLINTGILLDLFVSILLLGIFINKIGDVLRDVDVDQLKQLKD
jgi:hydrogenase-4 component E